MREEPNKGSEFILYPSIWSAGLPHESKIQKLLENGCFGSYHARIGKLNLEVR